MSKVVLEFPLLRGYLPAIKSHFSDKIAKEGCSFRAYPYEPRGYRGPLERVPVIKTIIVFIKIDSPFAYIEGLYFKDIKISVGRDIRTLLKLTGSG